MSRTLAAFLGDEPEQAWKRLKSISSRRDELRLPQLYDKLRYSGLKESQAKKVNKMTGKPVRSVIDIRRKLQQC